MPRTVTQAAETDAPTPEAASRSRGPSLNQVQLIGRLAGDPEARFTPDGVAVAHCRVATNEKSEPEFHDVVVWRQQAEFAAEYLHRGRLVYVSGRLHSRTWLAPDGSKRRAVEVIADTLTALDRPAAAAEPPADDQAS